MSVSAILTPLLERSKPWARKLDEFLSWWLAELRACMPAQLSALFIPQNAALVVRLSSEHCEIIGMHDEPQRIDFGTPAIMQIKENQRDAVVEIDENLLLIKSVQVPFTAVDELADVVAFQFKQHFPLETENLYVGFCLANAKSEGDLAELLIGGVRREVMERRLTQIRELGVEPIAAVSQTLRMPIKVESIERVRRARKAVAASLIAVLLGLMTALPLIDAAKVRGANQDLQVKLKALTEKSQAALSLKKTLDQRIAEANFLRTQMEEDTLFETIDFLSKESPADVWLNDLQYDGKAFRLSGVGADAADWVLKLQSHPMVNSARLENLAASGKEELRGRFQIRLEIRPQALEQSK